MWLIFTCLGNVLNILISSLVPLWSDNALADFSSLIFIEARFMTQPVVRLGEYSGHRCCEGQASHMHSLDQAG